MVYSEVPNFSEPNPEYLALMNKTVCLIFPFKHWVLCYNIVIDCCSNEVLMLHHRDLMSKEATQTTTTVPWVLRVSFSSVFKPVSVSLFARNLISEKVLTTHKFEMYSGNDATNGNGVNCQSSASAQPSGRGNVGNANRNSASGSAVSNGKETRRSAKRWSELWVCPSGSSFSLSVQEWIDSWVDSYE